MKALYDYEVALRKAKDKAKDKRKGQLLINTGRLWFATGAGAFLVTTFFTGDRDFALNLIIAISLFYGTIAVFIHYKV